MGVRATLRQTAKQRIERLRQEPAWRLGTTVMTLVVRLVGANLSLLRTRGGTPRKAEATWPPAPGARSDVHAPVTARPELERRLRGDEGCGESGALGRGHDGAHHGCRAARELGRRFPNDTAVVRALEETMLRSERPACVKRAAVDALVSMGSEEARHALSRMTALAERRAEWDRSHGDLRLLEDAADALAVA
jgi:hypothetical protein